MLWANHIHRYSVCGGHARNGEEEASDYTPGRTSNTISGHRGYRSSCCWNRVRGICFNATKSIRTDSNQKSAGELLTSQLVEPRPNTVHLMILTHAATLRWRVGCLRRGRNL